MCVYFPLEIYRSVRVRKLRGGLTKLNAEKPRFVLAAIYRVIQEQRSIFWEVIVSVIVRKKFI